MRVLIVEDNMALAETLGWMIEALGYDYMLAGDGPQALAKAETYHPHVMMIDIGLPGMNGYELCKRLTQEPHLSGTVLVAQTGWDGSTHHRQASEAGFHHHLTKPVSIEKLEKLLKDLQANLLSSS